MRKYWHNVTVDGAAREIDVDTLRGLDHAEAARRLAEVGPNELTGRAGKGALSILGEQFTATLMVLLIVAAIVSSLVGDLKDAVVILIIVALNALLGFTQEFRAEKSLAALKKMSVPTARVRRNGDWVEISARDLVPGDVVHVEAGAILAADGLLIETARLAVDESALTGESAPVEKRVGVWPEATPLADRKNRVHRGTRVTAGRGVLLVTETGMSTEIGRIATLLKDTDREPTPLQKRLEALGRRLAWVAVAIVAVVFALGLLRGEHWKTMFLTAVSLAVAAVPEGLPAVVTIALAIGARRMMDRRALIRKLPAVETLGAVTVICSDKTGTLTENRMTVTEVFTVDGRWTLSGVRDSFGEMNLFFVGAALCNDASLVRRGDTPEALGDPTESALLTVASRAGWEKTDVDRRWPRVGEWPFDSERKRMTTLHTNGLDGPVPGAFVAFTKGSVDGLLDVSTGVWEKGRVVPLDRDRRRQIDNENRRMAETGLRVLGVAFRADDERPADGDWEKRLVFVGMAGMIDPPRADVKDAVAACRAAGIRPVMITGDHPLTARAVAGNLDLPGGAVVTGADLDHMTDEELADRAATTTVFARVSPEHKLRIVRALQSRGQVVAMTGDGVNDAPALKRADIGVAMGITGTDVSKDAAAMVLTDDNFSTIVAAVEEGRTIADNLRKFLKYLLTTNSAEIWVMLLAPFFGMPLPLLPLQILWINLVTDGLPALCLGLEPTEPGVMNRPPRPPQESLFARGLGAHALWVGLLMAGLSLAAGYVHWRAGRPEWRTVLFTTLALAQMAHVMVVRSEREPLFSRGFFRNPALMGAVAATVLLQAVVVYWKPLREIFATQPLTPELFSAPVAAALTIVLAVELEKTWRRRR